MGKVIQEKLRGAREVTLAEVEGRSYPAKLLDSIARLFSPSFLVNFGAHDNACRVYQAALKVRPDQLEFIIGLGWVLCRVGQQAEALPWLKKAVAKAPDESSVFNDYGCALAELGRFDEAEPAFEKAVQLAPPGDELPLNNLARMRRLRQQSAHKPKRNGSK